VELVNLVIACQGLVERANQEVGDILNALRRIVNSAEEQRV